MTHIGIFGGGQLGMLLCQAARRLGLETTVLTPRRQDPAAAFADHQIYGSLDDLEAAARLVERAEVITFEIETVAPAVLKYLACAEQLGHCRTAPGANVLLLLQNKALQKQWLVSNGFPTAPYLALDADDIDPVPLERQLGMPFVQKAQRGGYDGRGVQIIRSRDDFSKLWRTPSTFEPFFSNLRELAVLVARNGQGELRRFSAVDLEFNPSHNILETVTAPADLPPAILEQAGAIAQAVIEKLRGVGLFAVELFLTEDGEVLINEISPRVHNAGHHTLEACETSQFEQHLRAIADLPLGSVAQRRPAVMRNLLYTPALEPLCAWGPGEVRGGEVDTVVHWYGKRDPRPYRKMGHVTCLADTARDAYDRTLRTLEDLSRGVTRGAP